MGLSSIYRGDTRIYPITIKQTNGTLLDLTGGTMFFTIKRKIDDLDADAIISKSEVCNGTTVSIMLTHEDTKDLLGTTYICDFQFVSANGTFVATAVETLKILKDVTLRATI